MEFSWLESALMGLVSGFADVLPVSAQAHRIIFLKFFGKHVEPDLLRLFIHIGIFVSLYVANQSHIVRMIRARKLSRIPKKKRKRPLDTRSLMDLSLVKTILFPVIIAYFFYEKAANLAGNMIVLAAFMFLNGLILYVPQYLPSGNKDSRTLSRVEGVLMGLGGATSVIPGFSGVGACASVASVCGVERSYGLTMSLMMNMGMMMALIVLDIKAMISAGIGLISFGIVAGYIGAGVVAFLGATLAIRIMRSLAANSGYSFFAYYCWGVALFAFILNLMA